MIKKCVERFMKNNPFADRRKVKKYIKKHIDYKTGRCKGIPNHTWDTIPGTLDPTQIGSMWTKESWSKKR